MKPRTRIARISQKKLASLGGRYPGSTAKRSSKQIKKKPRSKSGFARIYGSRERVEWVARQPCVACGWAGSYPLHNHHINSGGTGHKAGYERIVPLCSACHLEIHSWGRREFEECFGIDLEKLAAETQSRWEAHISEKEL